VPSDCRVRNGRKQRKGLSRSSGRASSRVRSRGGTALRFGSVPPKTTARREGNDLRARRRQVLRPWIDGADPFGGRGGKRDTPRRSWGRATLPDSRPNPSATMGVLALPTAQLRARRRARCRRPAKSARQGCRSASCVEPGPVSRSRDGGRVRARRLRSGARLAKERQVFGGPVATKQCDRISTRGHAATSNRRRRLLRGSAWETRSRRRPPPREALLAKASPQPPALDVADGPSRFFGGHGYIRDYRRRCTSARAWLASFERSRSSRGTRQPILFPSWNPAPSPVGRRCTRSGSPTCAVVASTTSRSTRCRGNSSTRMWDRATARASSSTGSRRRAW